MIFTTQLCKIVTQLKKKKKKKRVYELDMLTFHKTPNAFRQIHSFQQVFTNLIMFSGTTFTSHSIQKISTHVYNL